MDPDARIAAGPGKARRLCYHLQLSVDTSRHVITHVLADHADCKDSRCLADLLPGLTRRLSQLGLRCTSLLADSGYCSGHNYALLEGESLGAFIPPNGRYRGAPEGFTYDQEGDFFLCPKGKKVVFCRQISKTKDGPAHFRLYRTTRQDCPLKTSCCGKLAEKRIAITSFREEYERTITRISSRWGRRMKRLRQATVEPVLGTLLNPMGMRKINTHGLELAHKGMLMAAAAYNLQKLLHFTPRRSQTAVMALPLPRPEREGVFCLSFPPEQEGAGEKRIGVSKYEWVVQQAHS